VVGQHLGPDAVMVGVRRSVMSDLEYLGPARWLHVRAEDCCPPAVLAWPAEEIRSKQKGDAADLDPQRYGERVRIRLRQAAHRLSLGREERCEVLPSPGDRLIRG